jgi:hypothetical protein
MIVMIATNSTDSTIPVPSSAVQDVPVTVDSKGRVRVSKEQRQLVLAEFENGSELTIGVF